EEGKVWSMRSVAGPSVDARWTYTVSIGSEVERCGHIWKRSRIDEQEFLLLRQEGKKIWALYPYDDGGLDTVPFLMFDFGLKKGDTAHLYVDTTKHRDDVWVVEDVFDSVFELGQEPRHCQRVYLMKRPETKDIWVEGIGSLTNGMTYSPSDFLRGPSELICVQKATGDVVYHNKKYSYCYINEPMVSETYTGTLISMPNPATEIPVMPDLVMGLQCNGNQYILSKIGWLWSDYVVAGGVRYEEGDSVEIKGVLSTHIDLLNRTYFELEIDTIRKIEKSVVDTTENRTLREIGRIHYNAAHQTLVIESEVKTDRLEVFDAQGRGVLKANNPAGSVSVARLPRGLYLYRLTTVGTTLSGKFVR
ncbi:MAG: T9SS type A sorting domain-containing protein, partial [Bacteroidales bacterium]|nr:T9SS type A sorting domain-containing protein [Bacteroidales bacterium]